MGGRRSAQPTPIVERVAAKVFVHAEPADAARTVPAGRWWRPATKDRLVAAAAGPAAFRDAAPHQRRYRWHRFPPHGGKSRPRMPYRRSNRSRGSSYRS